MAVLRVKLKKNGKRDAIPPKPTQLPKTRGRPRKPRPSSRSGIVINRFSPADLWKRIQLPPTDSNCILASSINPEMRRVLIHWAENVALIPRFEILHTLDISAGTYYLDTKENTDRVMTIADETSVERMTTKMLANADELARQAIAAGKPRDAWLIRKECVEVLQSLGVTFKKPEEHKIIEEWDFPGLMGKDAVMEKTTKIAIGGNGNGNGNGKH